MYDILLQVESSPGLSAPTLGTGYSGLYGEGKVKHIKCYNRLSLLKCTNDSFKPASPVLLSVNPLQHERINEPCHFRPSHCDCYPHPKCIMETKMEQLHTLLPSTLLGYYALLLHTLFSFTK